MAVPISRLNRSAASRCCARCRVTSTDTAHAACVASSVPAHWVWASKAPVTSEYRFNPAIKFGSDTRVTR